MKKTSCFVCVVSTFCHISALASRARNTWVSQLDGQLWDGQLSRPKSKSISLTSKFKRGEETKTKKLNSPTTKTKKSSSAKTKTTTTFSYTATWGETILHTGSHAEITDDYQIDFDENCDAEVKDMEEAEQLFLEVRPHVDQTNRRLKLTLLASSDEPPVVISKKIPSYCAIGDTLPAVSVTYRMGTFTVEVKVGENKKNVRKVEEAKQIYFTEKDHTCVLNIDFENFATDHTITRTSLYSPAKQLDGTPQAVKILVCFDDGSKTMFTNTIPPDCVVYSNEHLNFGHSLGKVFLRSTNAIGTFGTESPLSRPEYFEDPWAIAMDQSCQAVINMAGHKCQEVKSIGVTMRGPGQTVTEMGSYYLVVTTEYSSDGVLIPALLNCAVQNGEVDFTKPAPGIYTASFGTPVKQRIDEVQTSV